MKTQLLRRRRGLGSGSAAPAATKLLMHFDGSAGSTTFTDSSSYGRNFSAYNAAEIQTTQSVFGGASLQLTPTEGVFCDQDENLQLTNQPFTIEGFMYFVNIGSARTLCSIYDPIANGKSYTVDYFSNTLRFNYTTDGSTDVNKTGAWSPVINTWYYVAVDRSVDNVLRLFAGTPGGSATMLASHAFDVTIHTAIPAVKFFVGKLNTTASANPHNGYIDELRMTIGSSRYPSDSSFTVPTAPFVSD